MRNKEEPKEEFFNSQTFLKVTAISPLLDSEIEN